MMLIRQLLKMKNGCELTKNRRKTRFQSSLRNVTMMFPVNLSLGCFRTAALLMVTLNMESRKPMGRVYPENRFKNAKARGSERVKAFVDLKINPSKQTMKWLGKAEHISRT